jgi:hypothetical protein
MWDEIQCEDYYADLDYDLAREQEMIDKAERADLEMGIEGYIDPIEEEKYLSEAYDRMREHKLLEEFESEDE